MPPRRIPTNITVLFRPFGRNKFIPRSVSLNFIRQLLELYKYFVIEDKLPFMLFESTGEASISGFSVCGTHFPTPSDSFPAASICRMASASEIGFQSCHFAHTQMESRVVGGG